MSSIIYLAELFKRLEWEPIFSSTPNDYERTANIYYFDITKDLTSYWVTTWGGTFDTPTSTEIQILFNSFLTIVETESQLLANENTFLVSGNKVFINLPYAPWQYFTYKTEVLQNDEETSFSSSIGDQSKPSDWTFGTTKKYKPYLNIPSLKNKLSDPISGVSLQPLFDYTVSNNDGALDDLKENNFFNTITQIKKTDVENPTLDDFKIIRRGFVESVTQDFLKLKVSAADYIRFLTNEVTGNLNTTDYPNLPTDNIDKSIPIGYGTINDVELILVSSGGGNFDYIAIEPTQVSSVTTVYNNDGDSISFVNNAGVIRTTAEASTSDLVGKTGYNIGSIVVEIIGQNSIFDYISTVWDITETNLYIALASEIGFYFKSGSVKQAVDEILKSDNAFLIQKNSGLLTIRQWGQDYTTHNIDSWKIINTNKIKKNFTEAAKYYMSSCEVSYNKNNKADTYKNVYLDVSKEAEIFEEFRKGATLKFLTNLSSEANAEDLSGRLLDRFGGMSPLISVDVTYNTDEIELLDKVQLNFNVNGRQFTETDGFIVRDVNASQDSLVLEAMKDTTVQKAILDNNNLAILDNNNLAIMGV